MSELAWKLLLDVLLLFWSGYLLVKARTPSQKAICFVAFLLVLLLFVWRLTQLKP